MPQVLQLKRSSTPNAVPTLSNILPGEFAINVYDARIFFRQDTNSNSFIREIITEINFINFLNNHIQLTHPYTPRGVLFVGTNTTSTKLQISNSNSVWAINNGLLFNDQYVSYLLNSNSRINVFSSDSVSGIQSLVDVNSSLTNEIIFHKIYRDEDEYYFYHAIRGSDVQSVIDYIIGHNNIGRFLLFRNNNTAKQILINPGNQSLSYNIGADIRAIFNTLIFGSPNNLVDVNTITGTVTILGGQNIDISANNANNLAVITGKDISITGGVNYTTVLNGDELTLNNLSKVIIAGQNNVITGCSYLNILSQNTQILNSAYGFISGGTNDIGNLTYYMVIGNSHTLSGNSYVFCLGDNFYFDKIEYSFVFGSDHSISLNNSFKFNFTFGKDIGFLTSKFNAPYTNYEYNFIFGNSLQVYDTKYNYIFARNSELHFYSTANYTPPLFNNKYSTDNLIVGRNITNTSTNIIQNSLIFGENTNIEPYQNFKNSLLFFSNTSINLGLSNDNYSVFAAGYNNELMFLISNRGIRPVILNNSIRNLRNFSNDESFSIYYFQSSNTNIEPDGFQYYDTTNYVTLIDTKNLQFFMNSLSIIPKIIGPNNALVYKNLLGELVTSNAFTVNNNRLVVQELDINNVSNFEVLFKLNNQILGDSGFIYKMNNQLLEVENLKVNNVLRPNILNNCVTFINNGELTGNSNLTFSLNSLTLSAPNITVNNNLEVNNNVEVGNNINVNGTLTATIKNFLIKHPKKQGWKLQYSSLESPGHFIVISDINYIEKDKSVKQIDLPDYVNTLCFSENFKVLITNYKHFENLYVDEVNVKENYFIVKTKKKAKSDLYFFWQIILERKDVPRLKVEFEEK